ncbi:hypothetical protein BMR1_03g01115 [Babesia microti strain RI]|uniref:Uncharacterized protein n=1 Tax=Babesia microti (strain RI) TaxID=1133968 RepID=A0A1R4ABD9_BABMR|nr:hypothetical protein BMR1_03g01115 [Babesia microti strain RI]SJK86308.1 hypothetical protein BMR1_03g01115 [Babesia microti strain RI]|eukprot:XP_012648833.2 hypothetical protein BMR1_03g01115 [Babesia microti strain RI]
MEDFDKGVKIASNLYEIFCRAYNIDQQFIQQKTSTDSTQLGIGQNPVEAMDCSYKKITQNEVGKFEIGKTEIVPNSPCVDVKQMHDEDTIDINLLNPFQCCFVTEPLHRHQIKPSPDKVTIASIIYLARLDDITRDILKIVDVNRENVIIKSLYTLTNKLDHEPGKTRISFQEMVSVMAKYVNSNIELPPERKVDSKPWVEAVEHNLLGI